MSAVKSKARKRVARKNPRKQGFSEAVGYKKPPKNRQFGEPDGNPRHNGAWKKEDTLRYKLEKLINGLDDKELEAVLGDPHTSPGVRRLATLLYKSNYDKPESEWRVWEGAMNQAYGLPKQAIEQTNLEAPIPLSPRNAPTRPGLRANLGGGERNERACADISETTSEAEERQRRRQGVGATNGEPSEAPARRSRQTEARNTPPQGAQSATRKRSAAERSKTERP